MHSETSRKNRHNYLKYKILSNTLMKTIADDQLTLQKYWSKNLISQN